MTKRKRTPPPSPKLPTFKFPDSLKRLATQCRQLREQSEAATQGPTGVQIGSSNDQAIDLAVDAQLNEQLNASLQPLTRAGPSSHPHSSRAMPYYSNPRALPIMSDDEMRHSVIRDAEHQLGIFSASSDPQLARTHFTSHGAADASGVEAQYYDQPSSANQLRFDPYVGPGQTPYFYGTTQTAPGPYQDQASHAPQFQPYQYQNHLPNQPMSVAQAGQSGRYGPYVNIAPHPSEAPRQPESQSFAFPMNQTQPGYYRLPPSYWQSPPPLETNAMTEANQRAAANLAAANANHSSLSQSVSPLPDGSGGVMYPDPATMEMAGTSMLGPGGGVFRNLTKERFGRYSVGGKLIGSTREIYGGA